MGDGETQEPTKLAGVKPADLRPIQESDLREAMRHLFGLDVPHASPGGTSFLQMPVNVVRASMHDTDDQVSGTTAEVMRRGQIKRMG